MDAPLKTIRTGRRAVLGAAAALVALGRGRRARARSTTTVRFALFGTAGEQVAYRRLIAAFEETHPGIAIEATAMASGDPSIALGGRTQPSPYQPWLSRSFTSDRPPHVFLVSYQRFRTLAARGVVEPIGPYLDASPVLRAEDYYPIALDAFRSPDLPGDGLGGFPQNASSLAVYYNRDIFAQLGVPEPATNWTWDEFAATAARLTVDRDGDGKTDIHGLVIDPKISRYAAFVWGAGGDFVDDPLRPTRLVLDTPAARHGLSWLASLGPAGLNVTPSAAESQQVADLARFGAGHAAMLIHSRRIVPTLRAISGLHWDVAPLPVGAVPANVLHSDAFCMAASTPDKEAAWTFIEFAVGPVGQRILAETGRTVPSLRGVAESDAFLKGTAASQMLGIDLEGLPPKRGRVFLDNIAIARPLPSIATLPAIEGSFDQAFKRAFYDDADIPAAVSRFTRLSRGILGGHLLVPRYNYLEGESVAEE